MPDLVSIIRNQSSALPPVPTDVAPQLNKLPGIKALLLDIYGTLLVSGSGDVGTAGAMDWNSAIVDSWNSSGHPTIDDTQASAMAEGIKSAIAQQHTALREQGVIKPEIDIRDCYRETLSALNAAGTCPVI